MNREIKISDLTFSLLYTQTRIEERIQEMAEIFKEESGENFTMVPVMTGAFYFSAQFLSHLDFPYRIFAMNARSYDGLNSQGKVEFFFPKDTAWIKDAKVIVLEDIVDTGLTAHKLESYFYDHGAQSVSVITLFYKPNKHRHKCDILQYGFRITDEFIVGYGLDYKEEGRWLKSVYQKKE